MADETYTPLVYMKQGGGEFVVANGGDINIEPGGKIVSDGTQAANIDFVSGGYGSTARASINAIITALRNVGIIAT